MTGIIAKGDLMPLVFVHGVNNRPGDSWEQGKVSRHSLFRRFMYPNLGQDPASAKFFDPMWGPLAATPVWDHAALPRESDKVEALGDADRAALAVVASSGASLEDVKANAILQTARQSMEAAVDTLWAESAREQKDEAKANEWAELGRRANAYARANPKPGWLAEVNDDVAFIRRLEQEIKAAEKADAAAAPGGGAAGSGGHVEALGAGEVWDKILEGADRVNHAIEGLGTRALFAVAREGLQRDLGLGMGDILVYMADRGTRDRPGKIIACVIDSVEKAQKEASADDPRLILVGHSLGGIILYEILSYYRPDIEVDVFASVGSQIGVLEEVKVFMASDPTIGPKGARNRVPPLPKVKRWINIYDLNDPGSFATEKIFEGSTDFRYTTGLSPRAAHSGYWIRPSFYERLAARVAAP